MCAYAALLEGTWTCERRALHFLQGARRKARGREAPVKTPEWVSIIEGTLLTVLYYTMPPIPVDPSEDGPPHPKQEKVAAVQSDAGECSLVRYTLPTTSPTSNVPCLGVCIWICAEWG